MRGRHKGSLLAAGAAVLALLATGCTTDGDSVPDTAEGSLEELAAKVDCDPSASREAAELRQANCETDDGRFVLATFSTDRGQREWLNEANDYGGTYLVGRKWVAVGDKKVVTALRGQLGGTVEESSHHSGSSGGGGSEDGDHSGHQSS
ncbi:hypothetical protein U9R90_26170 [Streptomyces sp. E11-3]|uniref:hypothetical protein n=1 Tax=Streptomyces sp. E11-3 TaxID=3110112 RepID=UPI00398030F9